MFATWLRRNSSRRAQDTASKTSPSPGPAYERRYHAAADFTEADDNDDDDDDSNDEEERRDEDGVGRASIPMLPLFSASYLDSLPVYSITHAIRVIVSSRTETTLTWDQLRSPQVSQFLVKPMQQQIRAQQFSRATLYALMANCLQFEKEAQLLPGNSGTSNTRAKVCELLAIKLLKEYSTRELIDALSYDFYPLQGSPSAQLATQQKDVTSKATMMASRTSTLEVAIRASAKHFLAHPFVVQQLEAIWKGAISFYSAADSLHLGIPSGPVSSPGSRGPLKPDARTPLLATQNQPNAPNAPMPGRRVALYDPRQASLFKLSRLRVPRYRFFLATSSLAVLIVLFLAVLATRSAKITSLELLFWFWSAGFMLDELVGFNEQGFALYIMSFWNIFDLGILVLLIVYYCMRAYGVFLVDPHHWNSMAYDVLAANAILLLPRIFSVLDHYRYFSQLLIAFRLMAVDLAAVLILVLISCSGFFVFFTMSKLDNDGSDVAYQIFQILMGYTPAAWEMWANYSVLEKSIMTLFLIICHFVVVTILITVLTNSFMAIASNANEEHQFLFAVNTISMVKNDALFSYVAPSNIFAWLLMPLRYCMPLKHFVYLNRTTIKATHLPLLLCIYLYERYWLASFMYEPTDLVEEAGHIGRSRAISFAEPANRSLFSPQVLMREESVAGYQKDRALEEVFRRVPDINVLRTYRRQERRRTQTAVRNWMDQNDVVGPPLSQWPTINSQATPRNQEWNRRNSMAPLDRPYRSYFPEVRSTASDPADMHSVSNMTPNMPLRPSPDTSRDRDLTDADGDDELVTNDEDEEEQATNAEAVGEGEDEDDEGYLTTPLASKFNNTAASSWLGSRSQRMPSPPRPSQVRRSLHNRSLSSNTILFSPVDTTKAHTAQISDGDASPGIRARPLTVRHPAMATPSGVAERRRSPWRSVYTVAARPRPTMARGITDTLATAGTRGLFHGLGPNLRARPLKHRAPSVDMSISSDNTEMGIVEDQTAVISSSFQTQMMAMLEKNRMGARSGSDHNDSSDRLSKLVLSRIGQMEQNLADVVKEMRELRGTTTASGGTAASSSSSDNIAGQASSGPRRTRAKSHTLLPRKAGLKVRPTSRRGMNEVGVDPPDVAADRRTIGKGKGVATTADVDEDMGFALKPNRRSL